MPADPTPQSRPPKRPVRRCPNGHCLYRRNTYVDRNGYATCKICRRLSNQRLYRKKKAQAADRQKSLGC